MRSVYTLIKNGELRERDGIEYLDFSDFRLDSLDGIQDERFVHTKFLHCQSNAISSIKEIEHLKKLVYLNISSNELTS